jgi:hypothetical protein
MTITMRLAKKKKKKVINLSVPFHFKKPYENSLFISF